MMYNSATAALYSEMYSFGMTLVIWSLMLTLILLYMFIYENAAAAE